MMPSTSTVKKHGCSKVLEHLNFKAQGITSLLNIRIHTTRHHMPEDLNPEPSFSLMWKPKSHRMDPVQASIQIFLFIYIFRPVLSTN
jgi:hypothetical protein